MPEEREVLIREERKGMMTLDMDCRSGQGIGSSGHVVGWWDVRSFKVSESEGRK